MNMAYEDFLNRVIAAGIDAAQRDYGDKDAAKLRGSIAGFEACRGKAPRDILDVLIKANKASADGYATQTTDMDAWWETRCYQAEVEWVLNVLSVIIPNIPVMTTARGVITANEILQGRSLIMPGHAV